MHSIRLMGAVGLIALILASAPNVSAAAEPSTTTIAQWPSGHSPYRPDPVMERKIQRIVSRMTLKQKVGQMVQTEIKAATPKDLRENYLGSVLNGGGSWPHLDKHATALDWAKLADAYYDAAMSEEVPDKVPPIWGTDAVHGNSNVFGATLYPHNIGLGAARDPALVGEIAKATARAVSATGVNWAFAPTLALVQDERWGRAYEGYSADPKLVRAYAKAFVQGLQGDLSKPGEVLATLKHYMGDGGTRSGINEGDNEADLATMRDVHAQGYYGGLEAGAQTVMASFSSWDDVRNGVDYGKMHSSRYMLTDLLKRHLGFDGFVVSDWDGIGKVPGCTNNHCPQAINAGIDMIMVSEDWRTLIANTTKDVESGAIPMSRIDDAVTRILRVKMRAHLFGRRPSSVRPAGRDDALRNSPLARRAVRESLVLLKNNRAALPLKAGQKILVVGKSADNLPNQAGGWSLTWQGDETGNVDFPYATSLLSAIKAKNGTGQVVYSATAEGVDLSAFDVVIAVIGETPYAESAGDIKTLSHTARYPEDVAVLRRVSGHGRPVVTIFESGRTAYIPDLLNLSDAFVAAWLPGSEGEGVTDVIFGSKGHAQPDFRGRSPFAWPGAPCPGPVQTPLFKFGYGLSYARPGVALGALPVAETRADCHDQLASK